jgi:acetoin utilization deacetylase AcuC-like enzyme
MPLRKATFMATGLVIDERYTRHKTGIGHPERPERISVLADLGQGREDVRMVPPRLATVDELLLVHRSVHVDKVAQTRNLSGYAFDADTPVSPESYDIALLAVGGLLALLDEVAEGRLRNGFACVRPPGHHAESQRAMGFCLFNNVAVGAAYLRHKHGFKRVLIVDWDVHHGNGTQHIFEGDPGVLYVSTHQYPFYPGTGALEEVGFGDGEGYTVNLPFPAGFGNGEYIEAFETVIEPVVACYEPDFVLISAGFDPHARDPLAGMHVTEMGFAAMARSVIRMAERTAEGRCVALLEGGYDLAALRNSAAEVLAELAGRDSTGAEVETGSRAAPLLAMVRRVQSRYWKL